MTFRDVLGEIPRPVRIAAPFLGGCVALAGLAVAVANRDDGLHDVALYSVAGVIGGVALATWILGIGFVYADARRRAMRPMLWALLVTLFPHLLGFLLYFVLRQPLASTCNHCGRTIAATQRFCSWCGASQTASPQERASSAEDWIPEETR